MLESLFNKVARDLKVSTQVFSWECCVFSKSSLFCRTTPVAVFMSTRMSTRKGRREKRRVPNALQYRFKIFRGATLINADQNSV